MDCEFFTIVVLCLVNFFHLNFMCVCVCVCVAQYY